MFGYATDETDECMPLTVVLAHKLNQKIAELRRSGELWWARPDSKTQVRFPYLCILLNCLVCKFNKIKQAEECRYKSINMGFKKFAERYA